MDMAKQNLLLLLLVGAAMMARAAVAQEMRRKRNTITHLKGFDGPLPFSLETGYVEVEDTHGVELFYYFIQSERNPAEDPVILWISGGPGCSGLSALFFDIGPLKLEADGAEAGAFPRLVYFADSWTKVSNVIFLDAPVGTGFSYAREAEGLSVGLTGNGRHVRVFLEKWLADHHPELSSNPLYMGGDSYGGKTATVAALEMANHPSNPELNLKGYLVGNPVADDKYDSGGKLPFMHGMGLISDQLYKAALGSCSGDELVSSPRNLRCANALQAISTATSDINPFHILKPMPTVEVEVEVAHPTETRRRTMLAQEEGELGVCMECGDGLELSSVIWATDPEVREMLGVRDGSTRSWARCTDLPHFQYDVGSVIPYHRNLTQRGYRALVYSGDHDMFIPFVGTQAWLTALGYPVVTPWRPWYSNRQVAGFTTEYVFNLTFATVKGGGHTAPNARPKECLHMLDRWTSSAGSL